VGLTILDKVILRQNLECTRTGQPLAKQQPHHVRKLFTLRLWPPMGVLEEAGERGILEGSLKVLVPEQVVLGARARTDRSTIVLPANQLVEDISIFLHLVDLHRLRSLQDREWREICTVVFIRSPWLEESANEKDFKESIGIFEEFESRSCLDKLICLPVEIAGSDYFKVLVQLIAEDYSRTCQ